MVVIFTMALKKMWDMRISISKYFVTCCAGLDSWVGFTTTIRPVIREDDEVRYRDQQRFFDKLRKVPYLEIKYGRMQKKRNTATGAQVTVEKGVDVHIAVDMLYYAHNNAFDTAILISGDGDLVPAVNAVKHFGKHVENAYFEIGKSYHLGKAADKFMLLTKEIIDRCRLK